MRLLIATRATSAAALMLLAPAAARADLRPDRLTTDSSRVVAVLPLTVDARDTLIAPLGYAFADLLSTDLARSKRLTLVERARLDLVIREHLLATSGVVDSATAPRAFRLLDARRLVVGSLVRRGDEIVFDTHILEAGTGQLERPQQGRAPLADVLAAEKAVAFQVIDNLGVVLTPQERALVEQRPTRNLAALLAYGQAVRAEVNGQYALAARAFRRAAAADPSFSMALARAEAARAAASGGAAYMALQRVNRPLESVPTTLRPGLATDPAFPGGSASITVDINRP